MPELWMKEHKVLTLKEENGHITDIMKIHSPELLPICLSKKCDAEQYNNWIMRRQIPQNREGLTETISLFGEKWKYSKNKASLSDQYWVKYRLEEWAKINFFTRVYSKDIGDMTFKPWEPFHHKINSDSPDLMTNGVLKKRWKQKEDKTSYLVKAGSKKIGQEPLSEVLASVLLEQLEVIPFIRYDLCVEGVEICSRCDNFITKDTELIPASYIYNLEERPGTENIYHHLLKMCNKFEIEGAREYLDGLIFIDTLIGNSDRNLGNIAFIRDVNTRKIMPAPLYDFGAAYWSKGNIDNKVKSKLFYDVEKKIFKRMKGKCNLEKLLKDEKYKECIETYPSISEERKMKLIKAIQSRNLILNREKIEEMTL